jgi:acyl dehydratase
MNTSTASSDTKYFEDHVAGSSGEFGPVLVEEEEIIEFARRYDPQVFHVDPEAARKTSFGGLVASGLYTLAVGTRLIVENELVRVASMGSPGLDELRWHKPVRPGDALTVRRTIVETRRSRSKPDRGVVKSLVEVLNQRGEVVTSWKGAIMVKCKLTARSEQ